MGDDDEIDHRLADAVVEGRLDIVVLGFMYV